MLHRFGIFMSASGILALSTPAAAQNAKTYTYDARGRLITASDGVGTKTVYSFDAADNRSNVTSQLQFSTSWQAQSLPHLIGYADSGGWAADVSISPNFLTYGPYTQGIPVGARVACWRMLIDIRNYPDDSVIATLDVFDSTAGQQLASMNVTRQQWAAGMAYQVFELPFTLDTSRAGHAIELRTYYQNHAYLRVEKIGYY
jgi:YD repeat-containing protein